MSFWHNQIVCNHSYNYRLNRMPASPLTSINRDFKIKKADIMRANRKLNCHIWTVLHMSTRQTCRVLAGDKCGRKEFRVPDLIDLWISTFYGYFESINMAAISCSNFRVNAQPCCVFFILLWFFFRVFFHFSNLDFWKGSLRTVFKIACVHHTSYAILYPNFWRK